jgi:sialate O-acetylesterase
MQMNSRFQAVCLIALVMGTCSEAKAFMKPAAIFTDNAVLQRGISLPVWGTANDGQVVTVTLNGQKARATTREGKWMVRFKPMKEGGPFTLTMVAENTITMTNIFVGEVWLCSGQSNMQWPLAETDNADAFIASSKDEGLRLFTVPLATSTNPVSDLSGGSWQTCNPDTVRNFSAVAYHFGRQLRKSLGLHVGLIHSSYGGSIIQAWTAAPYIKSDPESSRYLGNLPEWAQGSQNGFSLLYNAMIAPIVPYGMRGVIWYQGEGNTESTEPDHYRTAFPLLIRNWRDAWGQGDFPFLFVQLPLWAHDGFFHVSVDPAGTGWAVLRQSQLETSQHVKNTAMVVIMDLGDKEHIHPRQKEQVGERLALAAQNKAYGQDLDYKGPLFQSMKVRENKAVLTFEPSRSDLAAHGDEITGFTIAGADQKFYPAQAKITGKRKMEIWNDQIPKPVAVRYGWANYAVVNMFNQAGLPMCPFRTDSWPPERPFKTYKWPPEEKSK